MIERLQPPIESCSLIGTKKSVGASNAAHGRRQLILAAEISEGTPPEGFANLELDGCEFDGLDLLFFR
jgi:hypothetical protein